MLSLKFDVVYRGMVHALSFRSAYDMGTKDGICCG